MKITRALTIFLPKVEAISSPKGPAPERDHVASAAAPVTLTQWPKSWSNTALPKAAGAGTNRPDESPSLLPEPTEDHHDSVLERFADEHGLTCGQARWRLFLAAFPPNRRPFAWFLGQFSSWTGIFQQDWALVDEVAGARSEHQLRDMLNSGRHHARGGILDILKLRISRRRLHRFACRLLVTSSGGRPAGMA